jgi:putative FmdB family regulatory protein
MPTYGYECKSCKHSFDFFQSMKDEPLNVCPKCGKELRRLINGGTGVIFKGGGFYVTDRNGKSGGTQSGDKPAASACQGCPAGASSDNSKPACPKAVNS